MITAWRYWRLALEMLSNINFKFWGRHCSFSLVHRNRRGIHSVQKVAINEAFETLRIPSFLLATPSCMWPLQRIIPWTRRQRLDFLPQITWLRFSLAPFMIIAICPRSVACLSRLVNWLIKLNLSVVCDGGIISIRALLGTLNIKKRTLTRYLQTVRLRLLGHLDGWLLA